MRISDLDYIEDNVAVSITGGFGGFGSFGRSFTVNNEAPIAIQLNTEISQEAKGVTATNEANLTFNLNIKDFNVG